MKIGISACSDGQFKEWKKQNEEFFSGTDN